MKYLLVLLMLFAPFTESMEVDVPEEIRIKYYQQDGRYRFAVKHTLSIANPTYQCTIWYGSQYINIWVQPHTRSKIYNLATRVVCRSPIKKSKKQWYGRR